MGFQAPWAHTTHRGDQPVVWRSEFCIGAGAVPARAGAQRGQIILFWRPGVTLRRSLVPAHAASRRGAYRVRSAIIDARVAGEALVVAQQLPAQLTSGSQDDRVRQAQTVMASAAFGGTLGGPGVKG